VAVKLVKVDQLTDLRVVAVVIVAFLLLTLAKVHPAFVILGAAAFGALVK
jgi:hypothetical protein